MKEKAVVFDNFLTPSYHKELLNLMNGRDFPWHWNPNQSSKYGDAPSDIREYGLFHYFLNEDFVPSEYFSIIRPLLYQVLDFTNTNKILRSRGDMVTFKGVDGYWYGNHVDYIEPELNNHISCVYYVNDSDGETLIYEERHPDGWRDDNTYTLHKAVAPKANRIVIFQGNLIHTGGSPKAHTNRIIINSNFI